MNDTPEIETSEQVHADITDTLSPLIEGCGVALKAWPETLASLLGLWGGSVRIDPRSAVAIILIIGGGIAGNGVRLNAPLVGEVGTNLQIAVARDPAPSLRRGIQRLTYAFDGRILGLLQTYEHLSDLRSQRNELAMLETSLNAAINRWRMLDDLVKNEKAAFSIEAEQIRSEHALKAKEMEQLRQQHRALGFRMRPMVMVPEFGVAELDQLDRYATDRAVLEVSTASGYFNRLAHLNDRALGRLAAFRRNSEWSNRLEYANGRYQPRSAISSLLLAGHEEMQNAWADPFLANTGLLDELMVCLPTAASYQWKGTNDAHILWGNLISTLMAPRLDGTRTMFSFDEEAREEFMRVREEFLQHGESGKAVIARLWRETGPALFAKTALIVALFRSPSPALVQVDDVRVAAWVARKLLEDTAAHWAEVFVSSELRLASPPSFQREIVNEDPVAKMVQKLRKLGPCTIRTLFRAYSSQDYQQLQPVLDRAIELGLILRDGKTLMVTGVDVSVSLSVCQ